MTLKQYPMYKPTSIPWIGQIPQHWGEGRLRWLSRRYSGGTPDKNNQAYWEGGTIPWLNSGAVNDRLITAPSAFITQEAFENSSAKWIPEGALVIALAGQGRTKGMVAQVAFRTTCNQSMAALIPTAAFDGRFLYWWLDSNYQNIRNMAGGDLRDGLNLELLGDIRCPLPPVAEQRAIATLLDGETARIDVLSAEQRRLIELLQEKRQGVISHAVTKGLDPSVPMKHSGIQSLGDIPAQWGLTRVKYATRMTADCPHETPEYSHDGEYIVIRTADVDRGSVEDKGAYRVDRDQYLQRIRRAPLNRGDIVYTREGERWGLAALVPEDGWYCLGQRMFQLRSSSDFDASFLMWHLNANSVYAQAEIDTVGATAPHVNVSTIRGFVITHPPLEEQRRISTFISRECDNLDTLIAESRVAIELLAERRAALVSALVTGEVDVRSVVGAEVA